MGFVERAFTPPGTGGREAAEIIAQAEARDAAMAAAQAKPGGVPPPPAAPIAPKGPEAPPQFLPGQAPGATRRAQVTATTMLGAAATGGQTGRKTLLGQ